MRNLDNFRQAVESPKSWNSMGFFCPKNAFLQLKHYIQRIYLPYFQTLHTSGKSRPLKCKFSDFPLLALKFTKFLMSFSSKKLVFLQSLNHSSVSWEITLLYIFSWNLSCYWQKELIKMKIFRLSTVPMKISQIPYVIFQTSTQFFFKYCINLQWYGT